MQNEEKKKQQGIIFQGRTFGHAIQKTKAGK